MNVWNIKTLPKGRRGLAQSLAVAVHIWDSATESAGDAAQVTL